MNQFKLTTMVVEYLVIKSGKELQKSDLIKKFATHEDDEDEKEKKHHHKKHKEKNKVKEKSEYIEELLALLESEKLITLQKKAIIVSKPFKLTGKISISKRGDGFVRLQSGSEMFVSEKETGGAISGDEVEVIPIGMRKKGKLEGEVLSVKKRGREYYRLKISEIGSNFFYGHFLDMLGVDKVGIIKKKAVLEEIKSRIKIDDIIIVKLKEDTFHEDSIYEVQFIRFESDSKTDKDFERILMKYNFNPVYPDVISQFDENVNESTVADWNARVDLRDLYTITIDGSTAKDFDDAISFIDEGNKVRFYVHIADVCHYVKPFSALDDEAYKRATSIYMANRVVPMLPPELSENLCSLVANVNRLAFTVEMEGDKQGNIYFAKFYKSIIKVDKRYTYEIADDEIKNGNPWFKGFMDLANAIKDTRIKSGRVELNIKESYILTDEDFQIIGIKVRDRLDSHILVEEMMLSANVKVAEFIRKHKAPALYRIHEEMNEEKIDTLNSFLELYGFNHVIKTNKYEDLKKALDKVNGHPSEKIFNYILLRSFMQAYYSGEMELGHWGLGFKDYCHFTSPIRRYPDLICHRVLESILLHEPLPYTNDQVKVMGIHTSEAERKAQDAERDILKLKACRFAETSGIKKFTANITGIKSTSIFVELHELHVEGVIKHMHFTDEYELVLPNDFSFVSKKYSKAFYLGQPLNVELDEIDYEEIKIYLKPIL